MGTLTVCVDDAQGFLHDILLPAMNVPGLDRHLFSEEMVVLKGGNTAIAKESYLDVVQFKIVLRKNTDFPTTVYLNLELTPRDNYQTKAALSTVVISGHTIPTRSALASRHLRGGTIGAVTLHVPFSVISMAAPGLPALRSIT